MGGDELDTGDGWEEVGGGAALEEGGDGLAAAGAVVERPVVDVHSDEAVGEVAVEVAAELEGVVNGFGAMVEAVLDGLLDDVGDFLHGGLAEVFADAVAAEREGEVGLPGPPEAEVEDEVQAEGLVGELAFVDEEACVGVAVLDAGGDLVEGDDDVVEGGWC